MKASSELESRQLPDDVWCRACGNGGLQAFARSLAIPVNNARVFARREDALRVPTGDLELGICQSCGFIGNVRFEPANVTYDSTYEEQQSYSPRFTAFSDELAASLVERWGLHEKRIVEIGCGKGDFLAKLCQLGHNLGVGIDPTAVPGRLTGPGSERVTMVPEFYTRRTGVLEADAIVCRHTLEHVRDVALLVRTLRRGLEARPQTRIFFEVPDVLRVLREGAFWDVYYEHCSYFTAGSLARLFRREGFAVDDVRLGFDDQYILLEAHAVGGRPGESVHPAEEMPIVVRSAVAAYEERVAAALAHWRERIAAVQGNGGRVAIWGSGSKCVAFLSETGVGARIDAVVDVNPHRQGQYLPCSGARVDAPEILAEQHPDLVVVMNPVYVPEISAQLAAMRVETRVEAV